MPERGRQVGGSGCLLARNTISVSLMSFTQKKSQVSARDAALKVAGTLRDAGHEALFAGGCVRDEIMGRCPEDYDIATSATPDEVIALFDKAILVGKEFGVVPVVVDGHQIQVATFRADEGYSDARHPDRVRFVSPEEDVSRRDFTINGILADPFTGEVIDHVGGRKDIEQKLVRAIGDAETRFGEDRLRMLRAVRFASKLGFAIEAGTVAAIRQLACTVTSVSGERIREELARIIVPATRRQGLELLDELGLMEALLPEVAQMKGIPQSEEAHPEGDVFTHTLLTMEKLENPSFVLALAALLHDVGKPEAYQREEGRGFVYHEVIGAELTSAISDRLKLSNKGKEQVVALVKDHMRFKDVRKMRPSTLKRLLARDDFEELAALHRADARASTLDLADYDYAMEKYQSLSAQELKPPPLLNGQDLIEREYVPGPIFSRVLEAVRQEQLDGHLTSRKEALDFVSKRFPLEDSEE